MVIELRSFCTTGGGSSAVTSTKSMFALNRPALPCNALLPGPQTLRTSTQQRKPSDPNTLPSESCQCCSQLALLVAFAHIDPDLYRICVSWESCDKHAHIVTRPWQWLWHCSYYCECQPCDCERERACGLRNVSNTTQPGFDPTASTRKEQQVAKSKNWLARQFHFPGCLQTVCW